MMGAVAANVVGLGKFFHILAKAFLIPRSQSRSWEEKEDDELIRRHKYSNFMGPNVEVIGDIETKFCPKCHAPATQFRRTKQGVQIIRDGKVTLNLGNNVTISAGGKEQRGFPIRCPNGHKVRIE